MVDVDAGKVLAGLAHAIDALSELDAQSLTQGDRLAVLRGVEALIQRIPAAISPIVNELVAEHVPGQFGGANPADVLADTLIRMASHPHHYLAVFDDDGRALHLERAKRTATEDQRIMLTAKDRGCTYPERDRPAYHCQVHHMDEWAHGGKKHASGAPGSPLAGHTRP